MRRLKSPAPIWDVIALAARLPSPAPRRQCVQRSTGSEQLYQRITNRRVEAALSRANALLEVPKDYRLKHHALKGWKR